ncbi:MAG: hypothetical protein H6746_20380 [Deltaproteobacteria bacterium]|nr:hypothetical protein [Deltaproteobacteria bacterium]
MHRPHRHLKGAALALALCLSACADDSATTETDTASDTAADTVADTGSDTVADTVADTDSDSATDTAPDSVTATDTDTETETDTDTETEAGTDTDTETGTDTEADTDTVTDTETETDTEAETDTDTDTDTGTETGTETETETETETDTEAETETETDTGTETGTDTGTDTGTEAETETDTDTETDAETETDTVAESDTETDAVGPVDPVAVFGDRYWNVYRPAFLASYYEDGRVTDRIANGVKMFGDNTVFMAKALSTFVYEYRAAGLEDSLVHIHEILDAYAALDALPANPALGYLFDDPLDGYVYRSDRGPDYISNFCGPFAETLCWPDSATRDNEPSGDQMLGTLRGLWDVVHVPGGLVHDGVDLVALARAHAERLGVLLRDENFIIHNPFGQQVKRGPDQRWISWSFQRGAARISGKPKSMFESSWKVSVVTVPPSEHKAYAMLFIEGALKFTEACSSGTAVDFSPLLGIPFVLSIDCNEFNIGLAGDAAVISLDEDPQSPDWFSAVVDRGALISQGHAVYAMYARYLFHDDDPSLIPVAARFLDAPATPPRGDNLDPNGWCTSWRWGKDFDNPDECVTSPHPFETYSGIDYMLPRAMASAFGEFPE